MAKELKFKKEARTRLLEGINEITDAVECTLGAGGRNVLLTKGNIVPSGIAQGINKTIYLPKITKDGVSVARGISFEDLYKDMGAKLIIETAAKTCLDAGDATTTTCVLARELINNGIKELDAGYRPMMINKGIDIAVKLVTDFIREHSKEVDTIERVRQIAMVSSNHDDEVANCIADAFAMVGDNGLVIIEKSMDNKTKTRLEEGYWFEKGMWTPFFINDEIKKECKLDDVAILISDKKIERSEQLIPIFNMIQGSPLLIICDDIEAEPLVAIAQNIKNGLKCCVVQAPGDGMIRKEWLQDIAVATGGKCLTDISGETFSDVTIDMLGSAKTIISKEKQTKIINGEGLEPDVQERIDMLKAIIKDEKSDFKKKQTEERVARLEGKMAVVSVGGVNDTEMEERYDRIEDATCSVYAAKEEGYVSGAGSMFMKARTTLHGIECESESVNRGIAIVDEALKAPLQVILRNAGMEYDESYEILDLYSGVNVLTEKVENFLETGIIDSTKALVSALANASSTAKSFLKIECVIIEK